MNYLSSKQQGFTLVELLAVIAIIGILTAIIIPVIGSVRSNARNAECVNNLRQWVQAVMLYSNDHKGTYMIFEPSTETAPSRNWCDAPLPPYGQYLPATSDIIKLRSCPLRPTDGGSPTYYMSQPYLTGTTPAPRERIPLRTATNPSRFLVLLDVDYTIPAPNSGYAFQGPTRLNSVITPLFDSSEKDRHKGGVNAAFGDGHVSRLTRDDFTSVNTEVWTRLQ